MNCTDDGDEMARDGGVVHGVDVAINGNSKAPRHEEIYFGHAR